jgi:hypothetical protein
MKKFLPLFLLSCSLWQYSTGQELWSRKIDDAQQALCSKDSSGKCFVRVSANNDVNLVVTGYIIHATDGIQAKMLNDKGISNNDKSKYLRILLGYINEFAFYAKNARRNPDFSPALAQELVNAFELVVKADREKTSFAQVTEPLGYLATRILVENEFSKGFTGYADARRQLVLKDCSAHYNRILEILSYNPNIDFADSMITVAAYYDQDKLYNYCQNTRGVLFPRLKNHKNGLVKTLFTMAQMESGRSLTPFLDVISKGTVTIDSINSIQADEARYFKLLTDTRIAYITRMAKQDTPVALANFNFKLKEKALLFVKKINEAHDKPDAIRFLPINPLSPQDLYYLAVLGIDELYTSSFTKGVFQQLVDKQAKLGKQTDQLLASVRFDYFRKFIKISAGYNKLSAFLKMMPDSNARRTMNAFISGLMSNENIYDIEDAVDVADAFAGIGTNPDLKPVAEQILLKVKDYYQRYETSGSEKGATIYRLLNLIFNSYRDTAVDLSAKLGIPSITRVDNKLLASDSLNRTIVKLYFYGDEDKDGQISYDNFKRVVADKTQWKVEENPFYLSVRSLKGKPIWIFANRPLYDYTKQSDPDDSAKQKMCDYMEKIGLKATFVMHRGHSYHVPTTLKFVNDYDTSAKLIVLGSCGGYQNLDKVLKICPDAHIVSSKQTGTFTVNDPMLRVLFGDIGLGKSIVWPDIWPRIKTAVGGGKPGEMFQEYIPPHQNLGMIFIKAYKKHMSI